MRLRIFTEPQNGASYDQILLAARTAEECGFDAFFRSDHYLSMSGDGPPGPSDAWITLAALARDTGRIRLGTLVSSATFRLPGPFAITVAGVDAMSGGRIELGIGTGWFEEEHAAYGIPFPSVSERFERLEEQLQILKGLWTVPIGKRFSFEGRHYHLVDSPGLPKPVQEPYPPVIIGGAGPSRTPKLAAKYASEYNLPFFPAKDCAAQFDRVKAACEAAGRDPATMGFSAATTVCCGEDSEQLERRARTTGWKLEDLRQYQTAGSPAEVLGRLGEVQEAGASTVYLQILDLDDLDHIRLLGEEVLPSVA